MLTAAAVTGGTARADDAANAEAFAKRMFAGKVADKGKSYACFVRRYDAAHLRQHPQQKTTAMKLLVSAEMVPEDKEPNYSFALGVTFRARKGHFETIGKLRPSDGGPGIRRQACAWLRRRLRWRRSADRNGSCRHIGDRAARPPGHLE